MTPEQFRQVENLFHRGKGLPPEEQRALLDAECADDPEVRAEVVKLLAQADPEETLADLKGKVNRVLRPGGDDPSAAAAGPAIEGYEIIREIHRGGQGVVYQALQKSTKRKVAIKVLLEGPYASKSARRRFEREIELVAQLKHPNIIGIFHSGQTTGGQQYFVMDYVRGVPLDQYVRHEKLTLEDALKLFAKVCEAVNYAHQKGVIHRDLKPSNILVDSDGQPKVLDFGLAKLLAGPVDTVVSLTGQVMGTLPYMSPEQAEGNPDKIDIRTDVYALGVILYQMLTGHYPYPVGGQMAEVLKHIAETEPTPLTRSWKSGSGVTQRTHKRIRPGQCPIDDEVQTIVMRTLAKARERRYQSAGALASDIARSLAGEPIQARRDHLLYVAAKKATRWTARNERTALALAAVASVVLSLGVGTKLVAGWTHASRWYERTLLLATRLPTSDTAFADVRVIAITDKTDFEELARTQQLEGVRADKVKSWRRVHGRLMQRLVRAGARVVVWDIKFSGETPFDEDFVRGVRELDEAGVPVVTGVKGGWWLDESSLPEQSRVIAPHVRWGCLNAGLGRKAPWRVQLAAQRGRNRPLPSLSLAAMALWRHSDAEFEITLDTKKGRVRVQYSKPHPELPKVRMTLKGVDTLPVRIEDQSRDAPKFGLKVGDVIGLFIIPMQPNQFLARSTIEYANIFGASEEKLREWFKDRVVLIGDRRTGIDRYPHPDGRKLSGCYAHASAIDKALHDFHHPTTLSSLTLYVSVLSACASLGLALGLVTSQSHRRRYFALPACAAILVLISVLLAVILQLIWNPIVPFLTLLLTCELCSAVHRVRLQRVAWIT